MEVTRKMLDEYRSKRAEIAEISYRLDTRWREDSMIGVDTILDYRKGYPVPNGVVGFDYERYEMLQDRDLHRKEKLKKECDAVEQFVENIEDSTIHRIFQLYFIEGDRKRTQKSVAKQMHMDRSRISRKIDEYLKNAHKAQKAHL